MFGSVLGFTHHVLHFNRVVILVTHVVVDFIGIVGDVSDLLDVRCDGAVKPIRLDEVK